MQFAGGASDPLALGPHTTVVVPGTPGINFSDVIDVRGWPTVQINASPTTPISGPAAVRVVLSWYSRPEDIGPPPFATSVQQYEAGILAGPMAFRVAPQAPYLVVSYERMAGGAGAGVVIISRSESTATACIGPAFVGVAGELAVARFIIAPNTTVATPIAFFFGPARMALAIVAPAVDIYLQLQYEDPVGSGVWFNIERLVIPGGATIIRSTATDLILPPRSLRLATLTVPGAGNISVGVAVHALTA